MSLSCNLVAYQDLVVDHSRLAYTNIHSMQLCIS